MMTLLLSACKKEESNMVQSIQFTNVDNGRLTMLVGESFRVKYTVEPASLQETAVLEWTSSKENVATVKNGRISANEEGKTTITATCGNATATITVEVESVDVTGFTLPSNASAYVGASVKVDVTDIEPEGGSVAAIDWSIADESIAKCYVEGNELFITGVKQGTTKLIGQGLDVTKECSVTVNEYIPVKSVTVTLGKSTLGYGASTTVSLSILPSNASVKDVRWSVSPSSYAEFDEAAMKVTAGGVPGEVTITATSLNDNVSGSAELTIVPPVAESIKINAPGYGLMSPDGSVSDYPKTLQLEAEITPSSAKPTLKWRSLEPSKATVDQNGLVTAVGHGAVMIEVEGDGVKTYTLLRVWKKSQVSWKAYSDLSGSKTQVNIIDRIGSWAFDVSDPSATYINENGKSERCTSWMFQNRTTGQYHTPKITLPSNFKINYSTEYSVDYSPVGPGSGTATVDMGIGSPCTVTLSCIPKSVSFVSDAKKVLMNVENNGTVTLSRSAISSGTYDIYVNPGAAYDGTYGSGHVNFKCSDSSLLHNPTNGYSDMVKLSSSTKTGTYTFTAVNNVYGSLNIGDVSFTLIIK